MAHVTSNRRSQALLALLVTCFFWGLSFPLNKAFLLEQSAAAPAVSLTMLTAVLVLGRFLVAPLAMLALQPKCVRRIKWLEFEQALAFGLVTGACILLQINAIRRIPASTSAFLTQFSCIFVPLLIALWQRRLPSRAVLVGVLLVLVGAGVLVNFNLRTFHLARGELETIAAAFCYAVGILVVDARRYRPNRSSTMTLLMSLVVAAMAAGLLVGAGHSLGAVRHLWHSPFSIGCWLALSLLTTVAGFWISNHYQPYVSASEAGIIYAMEGVIASVLALWLPSLLARWGGFDYPNELPTGRLVVGGGLITFANLWLQWSNRHGPKPVPLP